MAAPGVQGSAAATFHYVKNANTGLCLTANQLEQPRNSVFTNTCVNAASQKWHIAGGRFTSQGNNRCLTADDIGILTYPCIDNFVPQQWTVDSTTKKWVSNDY
ncbi:ricin-type beta-trefoil lectin domain protein [Actinocrispum sp. NPDC049592]|uniref:ricin-type beta-trefoil lectin domain protein n=1 Tax=Actinocrispum sp. NPDC049592 TaxID=3154835 RepID=UPI003449B9B4